jgi:hypothetical protein
MSFTKICYDSTHGPLAKTTGISNAEIYPINEHTLSVRGNIVHLTSERDPTKILLGKI